MKAIVVLKERAGCPGGGKGALWSDTAFTLATSQDMTVCYSDCLTPWDCQSKRVYAPDCVFPALQAMGGGGQGAKAGSIGYQEEVAPTLKSTTSGSNTVPDVVFALQQNGSGDTSLNPIAGAVSTNSNASGRNTAMCVYTLQGNGIDRADTAGCNGCGRREGESYTLNTIDRPAVCYALDQQGGKGGANYAEDVMPSLCSDSHGTPHAVSHCAISHCAVALDCRNLCGNDEVSSTLQSKPNGGQSLNYQNPVVYDARGNGDGATSPTLTGDHQNRVTDYTALCVGDGCTEPPPKSNRKYIVRRLTPKECARLQGFPDSWDADVEGSDSARYKMWGNGIALPCAAYVMRGIVKLARKEATSPHDGVHRRQS